jgi:hypothetical protein
MSAERDVVFFLMKHKILDIIEAIIADCKNPRLMVCKLMIIIKASALIATKALSVRTEDPNILFYSPLVTGNYAWNTWESCMPD